MWKMIVRLDAALHHGEGLYADLQGRLQPLEQANLVTRTLQAENNVTELQCQLGEASQDINTLYRAVRRQAGPHPDEPSSSRARHVDRRPAQPEPEEERAFNDAASRSRDGPEEPDGELEDEEAGASDFDYSEDSAIDDIYHNRNYMLRRQEVLRDQIHNMTVQANNMECYLHPELQLSGGPLPLSAITRLYADFAPGIPNFGEYPGFRETLMSERLMNGENRFFLNEYPDDDDAMRSSSFASQMGLIRFRNRRIITRIDWRLDAEEQQTRITNLYMNLRGVTGQTFVIITWKCWNPTWGTSAGERICLLAGSLTCHCSYRFGRNRDEFCYHHQPGSINGHPLRTVGSKGGPPANRGGEETILSNVMLLMPFISLCLGLALYVVGKLKLAMMLRFIPYTVVAGFLAGSGILILQESLSLAAGMELWDLVRQSLVSFTNLAGASNLTGSWAQLLCFKTGFG
eukprot:s1264_g12.t1